VVTNKKTCKNSTFLNLSKISIVALLAFVLLSNCASAQTLIVDSSGATPGAYPTIQLAVDSPTIIGDIILVKPGIYPELVNLQYKADITIMSESANQVDTIVAGFNANYARNVTITGFNINGGLLGSSYGIYSYEGRNLTIEKNTISEFLTGNGILIKNANYNLFADNTITNNKYGIYIDSSYYGTSSYNTFTGNNILFNTDYGIVFNDRYISNNNFYNNYLMNRYNHFSASAVSIWNTTRSPGVNIIGGSYMGGNYWGRPDGTGFSQTHIDADGDGICDEAYVRGADVDYFPLGGYAPVVGVSDLKESDIGYTWINWSWTNPSDSNFNHSMVYLDGVFKVNASTEHFNATVLSDSTTYEIGIRTVDKSGNINTTWVNDTATTLDGTAPAIVTGLSEVDIGYTWINWSWTNPLDVDFDHCEIYIDGNYAGTVTSQCFNATGISQGTVCEIGIMTVDSSGNVNTNLISDAAKTAEQAVVNTVTPKSRTSSSGGNTGTELRILEPDEEEDNAVADLEETPLQSTPEVYEEETEMEIGTNIAEEASDATETTSSTPGFGVLTTIVVIVSMVLFRRKD
jgi:parallel beta-helix repeat protein